MAVVTVFTALCGNVDCRYDIREKVFVAVCNCGDLRRFASFEEGWRWLEQRHYWKRGINTWLS